MGLLFPASFGEEQAGPNPSNLSPAGVQDVSLFTGALVFSYPIIVPPGRRGIQPDLKLVYNSQAQNGWLGLGWDLSMGSIQRSTKNGIPTYNDSLDTFILQFQGKTNRLVVISTGSDSTGSYTEYRAQIESALSRVRYYAPSQWIITSKSGNQYQFLGVGQNTVNSQYFYWGLTKVFDPAGNFMQVTYPSLSSATWSGAPGPGGTPTAIISTGAVVGFMPASISYTGKCTAITCQSVTQSTFNQITFSYELRPDSMTFSMEGGQEVIATRLKTIQATSNNNTVRTYAITYSTNMLGTSLLTAIAQAGSDGTTLSTETFSYQGSASYTVTLSTSYKLPVDFTQAVLVDVNGDGLPDIVQNYTGHGSGAWLNTGSGWTASTSTWIPPTALINSSGQDAGVRFADINGDGLVDILQGQNGSRNAWLNNGNGWSVAASTWNPPVDFVDSSFFGTGSVIYDLNGDGLPDIFQRLRVNNYYSDPPFFHYQMYSGNWLNNGSGWGPNISTWTPPSFDMVVELIVINDPFLGGGCYSPGCPRDAGTRFADLNGDGLMDGINAGGGWLNTGGGWARQNQWTAPTPFVIYSSDNKSTTDSGLRFADINGDGLPDLVQYSSNPVVFHVWLNTGNGWLQDDTFAPSVSSISTNGFLEFADLNGDGVPDIIALSTNPASDLVYLGHSTPSNVLTSINNGLGGMTQITYAFSPPPVQPGMTLPPVTVVQSVTTSDGISGDSVMTSSYAYSGGLFYISRPYREFLGFQQVTSTDAQGNYTTTTFLQNQNAISSVNFYKGMISEQDRYDASGNLLTKSTYTVSYSTPFAGVYFPFVSEVDTYIGNKHSAVGDVYDAYGNVVQELDYGDVSITGDERTIAITYSPSTGSYLVGYPVVKQVFSGVGISGLLLAQTSFYYDSAYTTSPTLGELTKTDNLLSGGQDPVLISSYDAYGNATDTYDALYNATNGVQGNHVHLIFETTFYQFPQSVQQAVGSSVTLPAESFTYDSGTGQMLGHVDMNGSTTTYTYDVFGRLSTIIGPADQITPSSPTVSYQYNISTTPPQSIVSYSRVIHGSTMTVATYIFFDGLGRKMETKTAGPAGYQIASDVVVFNSLGLTATSYMPVSLPTSSAYVVYSSTQPNTITTYDGLGRIVEVVNPDSTISTRAYHGWTEIDTDANGHSKTYTKDAYGQIVEVDEFSGTSTYITSYHYDLMGNLTNIVNSLGQGTTLYFDTLSRKTEMVDPQLGVWQYQYDPNGNLIQQTDSKNQVVTMTYDPLNRRTFKVYPDSSTLSYSYDSGTFSMGKLSQVIDLSGSQQFAYDSVGDIVSTTRLIGGAVYVTSTTYDALGRETSVTYPDSTTVTDTYDASVLSVVKSASGSPAYATLTYSTSAPMKIGQVLYGNGMNAQYAYDPDMFRLMNLKSLSSATTVQNFSYQYDNVGNISGIVDAVGPMTQNFTYDSLNRISQASGTYGTNNYQYDSLGNFTLNSDNSSGSWGFTDTSNLTIVTGVVIATNGRVGNGLSFDGSSQVTINGSARASPPATMTIALWARPRTLGSGYMVLKSGSYFFPQIESDGSLDAKLELSSGEQTVHVSSGALFNLWSYFVLTYDGANISIYVNGQLKGSQGVAGSIQTSTATILLGSSFNGTLDELSVYPWALTASEVLQRYQLYPRLAQNQPFTPNSVPGGMTAGVVNTTYTFSFTAWDLNGNDQDYRIDWGTGSYQDTGYVQSGAVVQATHSWNGAGQYNVRMEAVQPASTSPWSPTCNILIVSSAIQTAMSPSILNGASANLGMLSSSARTIANTAGEALTGQSSSTLTIGYLGYQSTDIAPNSWVPQYLGQQGGGGMDASPPSELTASNLVTVQYSTSSSSDLSIIALNLLEHGTTSFSDANGNLLVENGRWVAYDFENRPVNIVTQNATLIQFSYDFKGTRTQQTVSKLNQSSQTTTYVGEIYEATSSTSSIKYIMAGPLRVAVLDSAGTSTYFLTDHLGGTNLLVNGNLSTVRTNRYMPFGSTFQTSGITDNDHKFTGKRLDTTGLYYYGARYYDPLSGRFISPDTAIQNPYNPQTLNRYAYSWNNPVKLLDTDGHGVMSSVPGILLSAGIMLGPAAAGLLPQDVMNVAIVGATYMGGFEFGGPQLGGAVALSANTLLHGGDLSDISASFALGYTSGGLVPFVAGIGAGAFGVNGSVATKTLAIDQTATPDEITQLNVPVTQNGLDIIKNHLSQFEPFEGNNQMIRNLQNASDAGQSVTGANANFYLHEGAESIFMNNGLSYEAAHELALRQYGVSEFDLYTPELIQERTDLFSTPWQNYVCSPSAQPSPPNISSPPNMSSEPENPDQ